MERATGIEPAFSAWEAGHGSPNGHVCASAAYPFSPLLTVDNPDLGHAQGTTPVFDYSSGRCLFTMAAHTRGSYARTTMRPNARITQRSSGIAASTARRINSGGCVLGLAP